MNKYSISLAIAEGNVDLLEEYGSVLKYLPPHKIAQRLELYGQGEFDLNPFEVLRENGYVETYSRAAIAYMNIHAELLEVLAKKDAAPLIYSFLLEEIAQELLGNALACGLPEVLNRYAELWSAVDAKRFSEFYQPCWEPLMLAKVVLINRSEMEESLTDALGSGDVESIRAFARLLSVMGLSADVEIFRGWHISYTDEFSLTQRIFDILKKGRSESVDAYSELLRPVSADPIAKQIQFCIQTAKLKYSRLVQALRESGFNSGISSGSDSVLNSGLSSTRQSRAEALTTKIGLLR